MRPATDPKRTGVRATPTTLLTDDGYPSHAEPGAFELHPGDRVLALACPGCGHVSGMAVGNPKPPNENGATWLMTGVPPAITLSPSINCVGCCGWHGWLRDGVFHSC